jgi:N-methylhydantoinase A
VERTCTARYPGQSFELEVDGSADAVAAFHAAHQARFGHTFPARPVELVTVRVRARARSGALPPLAGASEVGEPLLGHTEIIWEGQRLPAPVYRRSALERGAEVSGPALLVELSATTFLAPEAHGEVVAGGVLAVELA